MTTNHSLRAVIFDYGRVLSLPPADSDWANLANATGLTVDELYQRYWKYRDEYDRKEVSAADYWARVAERELAENELTELVAMDDSQWTKINPDMLHLARQLKEAGVKIAILSNMQSDMLKLMRAIFDWLPEFDVQIYSCEFGMVKPSREVYLECTKRLGIEPSQALFLDDKEKNIAGAEAVGMHTVHFHGDMNAVEKKLEELGVRYK